MLQIQIRDRRACKYTAVCLLLALIGLAAFLGLRLMEWRDYVPVEATVTEIYTAQGTLRDPDDRHTEVTYTFSLNGRDYRATRTEGYQSQANVGTVRTVRCDPDHPEQLEDAWNRNVLLALLGGGTVILVLLLLGLKQSGDYAAARAKTQNYAPARFAQPNPDRRTGGSR